MPSYTPHLPSRREQPQVPHAEAHLGADAPSSRKWRVHPPVRLFASSNDPGTWVEGPGYKVGKLGWRLVHATGDWKWRPRGWNATHLCSEGGAETITSSPGSQTRSVGPGPALLPCLPASSQLALQLGEVIDLLQAEHIWGVCLDLPEGGKVAGWGREVTGGRTLLCGTAARGPDHHSNQAPCQHLSSSLQEGGASPVPCQFMCGGAAIQVGPKLMRQRLCQDVVGEDAQAILWDGRLHGPQDDLLGFKGRWRSWRTSSHLPGPRRLAQLIEPRTAGLTHQCPPLLERIAGIWGRGL